MRLKKTERRTAGCNINLNLKMRDHSSDCKPNADLLDSVQTSKRMQESPHFYGDRATSECEFENQAINY